MPTIPELFTRAFQFQQQNELAQAERLYRQILKLDSRHLDSQNNLGILFAQQGDIAGSEICFRRAMELRPSFPEAHNNLGNILSVQGKFAEAEASFRHAVALNPNYIDALKNLGCALASQASYVEAETSFRRTLELKLNTADLHNSLGTVLWHQGKYVEAEAAYRRALELKPDYAEAYNNLGNTLWSQGKLPDAESCCRQALRYRPDFTEAHNNLGNILLDQNKSAEAEHCYHRALALRPDYAEAYVNLGLAFAHQEKIAQAEASYRRALLLKSDYAEAYFNLGNALADQHRFVEGESSYRRAIELKPEYAGAHFNLGLLLLRMGKWRDGWREYEWRFIANGAAGPRPCSERLWDGSPLQGRTFVIFPEQGLGDFLQFIRYARQLKERGAKVVVQCPDAVLELLKECPDIDERLRGGVPLPHFDAQASVLSLPGMFGTEVENVPAQFPYLHPRADVVERWRKRVDTLGGFKIGIVWQGNRDNRRDLSRSLPLSAFAALSRIEGVQLISLQKDYGTEQIARNHGVVQLTDWTDELDRSGDPLMNRAALMKCLDLVISVDTAAAHLAGALGVPVWMAISYVGDWRWLTGRDDSPWYPSMRVFRQNETRDWGPVIAQIVAAVELKVTGVQSVPKAATSVVATGTPPIVAQAAAPIVPQVNRPGLHDLLMRAVECHRANQLERAETLYRQILAVDPSHPDAQNNMGILFAQQGDAELAETCFRGVLEAKPGFAEAHNNLGNLLWGQDRFVEAEEACRRAVSLKPDYAEAYNNLGNALSEQDRPDEAEACYERALALKPDYADAHLNLGLIWLRAGKWSEGWREYEWRFMAHAGAMPRPSAERLWDGSPLDGRTLLILPEQGLGDLLQFIRYARLLKECGARVIVQCPESAFELFHETPDIDELVPAGARSSRFDVQTSILSLPGLMGTTVDTIPASIPYLKPRGDVVDRWRTRVDGIQGFKIGIAWQGSRNNPHDFSRSVPLSIFASLSRIEGVELISLQKDYGTEQIAQNRGVVRVTDWTDELDHSGDPLMNRAGLMKSLDLVISVDTATVHLAGGLGVPVWVALPHVADWRWLSGREDTPWYPAMRLFRQNDTRDWGEVFNRMAAEVRKLLG